MQTQIITLPVRSLLCFSVCVNEANSYNFSGHYYDGVNEQARPFGSIDEFFRIMNNEYDSHMFPQATVELRSFVPSAKNTNPKERATAMDKKKMTEQTIIPGQKATFVVHVKCRQNATWQGSVDWLEGRSSQQFRSSLELIKLMDSALNQEAVETPTWE
jgi:hypothetical protein